MRYVIGFSRKRHFLAILIRWFTQSTVSHTYLRQVLDNGHDYIFESTQGGVQITFGSVWRREKNIVIHEFEVVGNGLDDLNDAWATVMYNRLGRPYGTLQLLGDAYVIIRRRLTGKSVRNPLGLPWTDVCSELAHAWILSSGIGGFDDLDPETVTAEDILSRLPGHSRFEEIEVRRDAS